MHVVFSVGSRHLVEAFLVANGFVMANGEDFRCADGWERRIHYLNGRTARRAGGKRKGAGRPRKLSLAHDASER